jgi:Ser/Thr protein kinase RdoA (MazF antagonist)
MRLGCPDRRLDRFDAEIDALTGIDGAIAGLRVDELVRLRRAKPQLKRGARDLAGYGLPDTLGHGDLHLGNVAKRDGKYLFFDWGQGCVSHPFIDARSFVQESDMESMPEEAYLAPWAEYESIERLREALALAEPLCRLPETMDQYNFCRNLRPEPEEFPESLARGLRTILQWADRL